MLSLFWHDYLFTPLLNLLIWLYNGPASGSLGFAVIDMTVGLRLVLIPLSIIAERNSLKYERIEGEIATIQKEFKDDTVARKEHTRALMRASRIRPWASAVLLGIQLLALVLLYQVFVGGMTTDKLSALYPSVSRPDLINTRFLLLDVSLRNIYAAAFVGALLYFQIWRSQRRRRELLERNDIIFRYAFPLLTFVILASLPSIKVVFILTSMAFSYIIHLIRVLVTKQTKAAVANS